MSTSSIDVTAVPIPARPDLSDGRAGSALLLGEPIYGGLTLSAWLKISVIAVLMAALFRFNLARLWTKTNLFYGQANWEHATWVPLVGLYYLYVWRDNLLNPEPRSPIQWTLAATVGLLLLVVGATALSAAAVMRAGAVGTPGLPLLVAIGLPVAVIELGLFARRAPGLLSPRLRPTSTGEALEHLWSMLGLWLMLMVVAWGSGFFLSILSFQVQQITLATLAGLSLTTLAALVLLAGTAAGRRVTAAALPTSATWFGTFVMMWGVLFSFWGIYPGQNDFFKDVGMVATLFGVVLLIAGWRVMRTAWFPILFLLCALPWPDQIYSRIAGPLQMLAARVAVGVLNITGVAAAQIGTKIVMPDRTLNVAEACAGLRSLMTFISLASAVAFLSNRSLWQKLVIAASAVPIAIFCNVMRVSGQGLLDHYWNPQISEGFAHSFTGLVLLIPGFFLILGVWWLLDHLFIDVEENGLPTSPTGNTVVRKTSLAATAPANGVITRSRSAMAGSVSPRRSTASTAAQNASLTPLRPRENPLQENR